MSVLPYRGTVAELGDQVMLISVSGELDLHSEPEVRSCLASTDGYGARAVVLDLSGVSFLDSTICGLIVGEAKRRRRSGGELVLVGNGSHPTRVLRLAGVDRVVRLFPTLHDALQTLVVEEAPR
jgi:anti-sigma B factor antagonist